MKNRFKEFLALHNTHEPVLIGNAWNAQSAKVLLQGGFKVIGTSSAAVAESLGYADGQEISFEQYLTIIKLIVNAVNTIVTVDLEGGYGATPEEVVEHIITLYNLGVSGINIEDSVVIDKQRQILDPEIFADKLQKICALLKEQNAEMFINVRSDSFLLGLPNALEDALHRIDAYQSTGVHGLFFPCISNLADIARVTSYSKLPVNVMYVPGLPNLGELQSAGVKRISMGPFLNMHIYQELEIIARKIINEGGFNSLSTS